MVFVFWSAIPSFHPFHHHQCRSLQVAAVRLTAVEWQPMGLFSVLRGFSAAEYHSVSGCPRWPGQTVQVPSSPVWSGCGSEVAQSIWDGHCLHRLQHRCKIIEISIICTSPTLYGLIGEGSVEVWPGHPRPSPGCCAPPARGSGRGHKVAEIIRPAPIAARQPFQLSTTMPRYFIADDATNH